MSPARANFEVLFLNTTGETRVSFFTSVTSPPATSAPTAAAITTGCQWRRPPAGASFAAATSSAGRPAGSSRHAGVSNDGPEGYVAPTYVDAAWSSCRPGPAGSSAGGSHPQS